MLRKSFIIGFFLSAVIEIQCANILALFPAPSISHQVVYRPITQALAKRGHNVTVITPDPIFKDSKFENLTEIDVKEISYSFKDEIFTLATTKDIFAQTDILYDLFYKIFDAQLKVDDVQRLINDKNNKFDVIFSEVCFHNSLAISHVFKAPVIQISSLGSFEPSNFLMGSVQHPVYYPTSVYHRRCLYRTFWERLQAFYTQIRMEMIVSKYERMNDEMLKKHFPDIPSLKELEDNVALTMLNVHPIWENNRPVPPNVVYLGGLPMKPDKELPKDLKSYLDSSKHGVIYMSFGTNVSPSLLPTEKVQIFLKVFSKLPYDVLFKFDKDEVDGRPKNVKLGKWFPQSDLLKHPKVKLFITQGGLQSTDETIQGGVPVIGIPMLADQWFNVDHYVNLGIGKHLEIEDVTEESFMDAVKTVIEDKSYRQNIQDLRERMFDQPETALDRAIYWTEHVIKYKGGRHLRAAGANLHWTQYYDIDIGLFLLGCGLTVIFVIVMLLKNLIKLFSSSKVKKE